MKRKKSLWGLLVLPERPAHLANEPALLMLVIDTWIPTCLVSFTNYAPRLKTYAKKKKLLLVGGISQWEGGFFFVCPIMHVEKGYR